MSDDEEEIQGQSFDVEVVVSGPSQDVLNKVSNFLLNPNGFNIMADLDSDLGLVYNYVESRVTGQQIKIFFGIRHVYYVGEDTNLQPNVIIEPLKQEIEDVFVRFGATRDQLNFSSWIVLQDRISITEGYTEFFETDAIPQDMARLVNNDTSPQRPTKVDLGTTFTLDQFKRVGPFFIPVKLVLEDFTQEEIEIGCFTDLVNNIEYPVQVTSGDKDKLFIHIYCAKEVAEWVGKRRNTLDIKSRKLISKIHILTADEVIKKEKSMIEEEKKRIRKRKKQLQNTNAEIRQISKLTKMIRDLNYENMKKKREDKRRTEHQPKRRRLQLFDPQIALKF